MIKYLSKVHELQSYFDMVVLTEISTEDNIRADALSRLRSSTDQEIEALAQEVIILVEPSITPKWDVMEIDEEMTEPKWATEIIQYLKNRLLSKDKAQS